MTETNNEQRIKTPFKKGERDRLQSWSKFAKEKGLLNGYQRKVIYEAGKYQNIFIIRLAKLNGALRELEEHFGEEEKDLSYDIRTKGYRLYLDAKAEDGDADFQFEAGDSYRWGICGAEEDDQKAIYWFEKATAQGHLEAAKAYADYLITGEHIEKDEETAASLYKIVSDKGIHEATYELALCYFNGSGVPQDNEIALKYMKIAAEEEINHAQEWLGCVFYNGNIVEQDFKTAIAWLEKANTSYATYVLGECYYYGCGVEMNYEVAFKHYNEARERGSPFGECKLGVCYLLGRGCQQDSIFGFELIASAYHYSVDEASYWLGWCYLYGYGTEISYKKAIKHFTEAEDTNDMSNYYLGYIHRHGYGCKRDHAKAFEYFMKAAENEKASGQMCIGRAFYLGEGVQEDNNEAVKWFKLAHDNGDDQATFYLGQCLYNGYGIEKNEQEAIAYLRKAAEEDNEDAIDLLQDIGIDVAEYYGHQEDDIIKLHSDLKVRASLIYSRITSRQQINKDNQIKENVVNLEAVKRAKLDLLMSSEEDDKN